MRVPRVPKVPRPKEHNPLKCTVCKANAKSEPMGFSVGGRMKDHPKGWRDTRDIQPAVKVNPADVEGHYPAGKHRHAGTSTRTREYKGRHRAYDAKHRR